MMEEIGTVVELKGKHIAVVLCQKTSACQHCPSSGACHIGDDGRSRLIESHNSLGAQVGDRVKIATSTRNFLQSSFVLYIVPLIGLVLGAGIGAVLGARLEGLDPNVLSAILGFAFMGGAFAVIKVGSRALVRENFMPAIVAILEPEQA